MIIIVCGVSGTGKSTIGKMLAEKLTLPFYDADDFHPDANVQKMKTGIALNDKDRQPWLESLSNKLAVWESSNGAVLACSALKEAYRETLKVQCKKDVTWIILDGSKALLTERLDSRKGHYFNSQLLDSQLNTLELPDYGWLIDIQQTPKDIVNMAFERLQQELNA